MNAGLLAFSGVMFLCSICNVVCMTFRIPPPPTVPWLGCWLALAIIVGALVALESP